ncbi:MAG: type II toxin-antitoxin system HicA family toxin [Rhodospirillales bacterium]|nr:type II toxin-antitoxin system HicA family toxin [Rhodospirillales bacterium]
MVQLAKLWDQALAGSRNTRFADLIRLAEAFGFRLRRISGSHHILAHPKVGRPLNLQPGADGKAKPYQVRQFIDMVEEFGLSLKGHE